MAFVDDLTTLLASAAADTDIIYVGKPGDPDPDRQMTLLQAALALLVRAGNGSAAAPSVAFDSDPNTGLYREAADQLGLVAGGTRRVRVQNAAPYLQVNDGALRDVFHVGNVTINDSGIGTSIRFPNGIQVAYATSLGLFATGAQPWTFPEAFAFAPAVFATTRRSDTNASYAHVSGTTTGTECTIFVQGNAATVQALAIGKWFA